MDQGKEYPDQRERHVPSPEVRCGQGARDPAVGWASRDTDVCEGETQREAGEMASPSPGELPVIQSM